MKKRRKWRVVSVAALLAVGLFQSRSHAFVESTETDGELPSNISGVWLLVSQIEYPKATATPEPGSTPAPAPAASPQPGAGIDRYFCVANLIRVVHFPKDEANAMRAADVKMEEASAEKAKAILAKEPAGSAPVQTATGDVEGGPKVLVPTVPERRKPGTGDDVDIFLLDVAFPKEMQAGIEKAQHENKIWAPSAKELAELKTGWSTLKPSGKDEISKIDWKVIAHDKYDDNFQMDPTTQNAKFAISGNEEMLPKPNVPKTNIIIYGADDIKPNMITGKHTRAMMATAPFPIPIEMKGTFRMYRVADLPKGEEASPAAKKKGEEGAAPAKKKSGKK
ncbi:MAG TPA: hypothetical protein VGK30_03980 [Candidatus Binatia bacterium]|jgi:hypothetical protein